MIEDETKVRSLVKVAVADDLKWLLSLVICRVVCLGWGGEIKRVRKWIESSVAQETVLRKQKTVNATASSPKDKKNRKFSSITRPNFPIKRNCFRCTHTHRLDVFLFFRKTGFLRLTRLWKEMVAAIFDHFQWLTQKSRLNSDDLFWLMILIIDSAINCFFLDLNELTNQNLGCVWRMLVF